MRTGAALLAAQLLCACGVGDEVRLGIAAVSPHDGGGSGGAVSRAEAGPDAEGPPTISPEASLDDGGPVPQACGSRVVPLGVRCPGGSGLLLGDAIVKWRIFLGNASVTQTPLVANLTDDNGDGLIDNCDVPDVLVMNADAERPLSIYSGASGEVERTFQLRVDPNVLPAIGDLDRDGRPDLVLNSEGRLQAMTSDGVVLWSTKADTQSCNALSLYDIEGDGYPEVLSGSSVYDRLGTTLYSAGPGGTAHCAPTAADVTGDGQLEMFINSQHIESSWKPGPILGQTTESATAMVGNLDGDVELEVVNLSESSISFAGLDTGDLILPRTRCGTSLPALADLDGNGIAEILLEDCQGVVALKYGPSGFGEFWRHDVGVSVGGVTVFDLTGNQAPIVVVTRLGGVDFVEGNSGALLGSWNTTTQSGLVGPPIVADVDADGSADILFVAESGGSATVVALSESRGLWSPARRIWNQAAYSVINVNEDGSFPGPTRMPGRGNEVFGSNLRLQGGQLCVP